MNLYEARDLARALMTRHGLADWTFRFDRARRRFGSCQPRRKLITLSRPLTFLNPQPQVRDTILHEIAHALTPDDGHGRRWRAVCSRIGAAPQRCYDEHAVVAPPRRPARYQIGCPRCGWWADRHRLLRRRLVCRTCGNPVCYRYKLDGDALNTSPRPAP